MHTKVTDRKRAAIFGVFVYIIHGGISVKNIACKQLTCMHTLYANMPVHLSMHAYA